MRTRCAGEGARNSGATPSHAAADTARSLARLLDCPLAGAPQLTAGACPACRSLLCSAALARHGSQPAHMSSPAACAPSAWASSALATAHLPPHTCVPAASLLLLLSSRSPARRRAPSAPPSSPRRCRRSTSSLRSGARGGRLHGERLAKRGPVEAALSLPTAAPHHVCLRRCVRCVAGTPRDRSGTTAWRRCTTGEGADWWGSRRGGEEESGAWQQPSRRQLWGSSPLASPSPVQPALWP